MSVIQEGIEKGLISFDEERKYITYTHLKRRERYTDPEEPVRAESYLQLILTYGYDVGRIELEVNVPRRTPNDYADIVVFGDDERKQPYIIVETKQPDATDAEFLQAIEQGFGNTHSLKATYLWVASGRLNEYFDVAGFPAREREKNKIADLPKAGRTDIPKAKYYRGGQNEFGERAFDIGVVSEKELEQIFKQAHDALWAGGKRNPAQAFDELDKLIFCKIWDEKGYRLPGTPYDFQVFTKEKPEKLQERIQGIYEQGRAKSPEVFKENIRLEPSELERVVGYLTPVNMNKTDLDSKGRAFETFLGSFFRGEFGQYFTPRPIVEFITDVLPITHESLVLDPACGSGGFLLYILDRVRRQADKMLEEGYFALGAVQHYNYWHNFAENNLFGIEINEGIARTAKMNMIIHDDGHTNVIANDGLENLEKLKAFAERNGSTGYVRFAANTFDAIATNPPFGSTVKFSEHRYMEDYDLGVKDVDWILTQLRVRKGKEKTRDTQKSEILFIEQCYNFLKPGGFLGMVVPDGILTNSSLQPVRDWIEDHFRIVGVVSMPQTAFAATGAGVKSSVIFLQKYNAAKVAAIEKQKEGLQERLFKQKDFGPQIRKLEREKQRVLKKGDAAYQQIGEELVNKLRALESGGTVDAVVRRELEREAKAKERAYKKSEGYKQWRKDKGDEFNEQINGVKEALYEAYVEQVRQQLTNYPIFMAIAEDIGYDATGRPTGKNELPAIAAELKRFIGAVQKGEDSFFVSTPA